MFNWLRLEKVAFNRINWKIIYTGVSGTGRNLLDDMGNNFCEDTKNWWRTEALKNFCAEDKTTESITFRVPGDGNIFNARLYVPTDLWNLGDAAINLADVFNITDELSKLQGWEASSLPDQDSLIEAVHEYLPSWIEIYSIYVHSGNLLLANRIYNYYVSNLRKDGGDFEIEVALYALRNYEVKITKDVGDKTTYYNIYNNDGIILDNAEGLSEAQMEEFIRDSKVKAEYTVHECDAEGNCTDKSVPCTDSDFDTNAHGCGTEDNTGSNTVWGKIKKFAKKLEELLRKCWSEVKSALASGWYRASNFVKEFIYRKFPLTFASERTWTISVIKGTTFDGRHNWDYEVTTNKTVQKDRVIDASEGFTNDQELESINGHAVENVSEKSGSKIVSTTTIVKTDEYKIKQITEYINVKKDIIKFEEILNLVDANSTKYYVTKKRKDAEGNELEKIRKCDNRLAYVIELMNKDVEIDKYNSDEFASAYEAIHAYNGDSHHFSGVYTDYASLAEDGAFNWPLEYITSPTLTSCRGKRSTVLGTGTEIHGGDDIAAPAETKILAAKSGKVIVNRYNGSGYGYYVVLQHEGGWYTLYAHMVRQSTLAIGTEVAEGDVIGYVGTTGRSTGNHLHFEIRYGDPEAGFWAARPKEPLLFLDKTKIPEVLYVSASTCPDKSEWGI